MEYKDILEILQTDYARESWKLLLEGFFQNREFFAVPIFRDIRTQAAKNVAKSIFDLGEISLNGNIRLKIFEIELLEGKNLGGKVSLRNLVSSEIMPGAIDGAFVVFYSEGQTDWRFSFISKWYESSDGQTTLKKEQTHPKRYTYVLGQNQSCRTASERFATLAHKKGIALKDLLDAFSVEKLTKEFFKTYKEFYDKFWKHLVNNLPYYDLLIDRKETEEAKKTKPIRNFTKLLLGRLVFLQFLQKKGWMGVPGQNENWMGGDINFTQNLYKSYPDKEHFHSKALKALFFETLNHKRDNDLAPNDLKLANPAKIPYLNGGLFDIDISHENHIDFPQEYFRDLFDFFQQYNFTIDENDPYENEIGIDPEMLGHIFENLLEENREKGTFYTPKEIVHYMCRESLIQYLRTHLPECTEDESPATKKLEAFIRTGEKGDEHDKNNFLAKRAKRIEELLDAVKICDPAIGSGAFPMGLLQEIFNAKMALDWTLDRATVKKEIIQNSIYGVDIESGAVDIARLRFWLALVVEENEPQPLPNLDYKIMQGDSLVENFNDFDLSNVHNVSKTTTVIEPQRNIFGSIIEPQLQFSDIKVLRQNDLQGLLQKFFQETDPVKKATERNKINKTVYDHIDYNLELSERSLERQIAEAPNANTVGLKTTIKKKVLMLLERLNNLKESRLQLHEMQNSENKSYFLWHLFFGEVFSDGGFDIVIGNPPYIQLQKNSGNLSKQFEKAGYETFEKTGDIYSLFYEKGWQLLKPQGVLCFITSNKWMRAGYGESTRKFFAEKTNPILLVDFAGQKVFDSATVDVNILMFTKDKNRQQTKACLMKSEMLNNLSVFVRQASTVCSFCKDESWVILSPIGRQIKEKIERGGTPLKDWPDITINYGIKTGCNDAFIITGEKRKELIEQDPKSAEIIRPILRGRDIKRYGYEFADLWLINCHNGIKKKGIKHINTDDYIAIKRHLDNFSHLS